MGRAESPPHPKFKLRLNFDLSPQAGRGEGRKLFLIDQIVLEDRHLELERAIIVLVVDEEHADELLAD